MRPRWWPTLTEDERPVMDRLHQEVETGVARWED